MDDRADVVSVFLCYPIRNRISDMIGFEGLNTARSFVLLTITITIPLLMVLRNLCIFVVASLPSWLFVDNVLFCVTSCSGCTSPPISVPSSVGVAC